jgi:hypothetical protein
MGRAVFLQVPEGVSIVIDVADFENVEFVEDLSISLHRVLLLLRPAVQVTVPL